MNIYINGTAVISAQNHLGEEAFPKTVHVPFDDHFRAQEPSYKEHIAPNMIRRMGRAIKMGVSAALRTLEDAGISEADAVVCGTGIGCFEDSEKFLLSIIDHQENLLTPTAFIQSTHNTVGAQIALLIKCHQYNMTYVQRGFSFESALLDAMLLLAEGEAKHVLTGGIDELTPGYLTLQKRAGYIKSSAYTGERLRDDPTPGHYLGEGAGFFVLSSLQTTATYARLQAVTLLHNPASLALAVNAFLQEQGLEPAAISLVLTGHSGDVRYESQMQALQLGYLNGCPQLDFKQYCGEYMTSGSFALWLAASLLKTNSAPPALISSGTVPTNIAHVLIVNHFRDDDYSLILVSRC